MDIATFFRIAARRWIVTVPLLALTVIVMLALASRVAPVYKAEGSSLLLPPIAQPTAGAAANPSTGNPYVDTNPGLSVTAAALTQSASQPDVQRQQQAAGHSSTYKITLDDKAPILTVSDTASTPEQAVDSVISVQDLLKRQLAGREDVAAVPAQQRITVDNLVVPEGASEETGSKVRLAIAVLVLGLAAVIAGALTAETWAVLRRRRRLEAEEAAAEEAIDEPRALPLDEDSPRPTSEDVPVTAGVGGSDRRGNDPIDDYEAERARRRRRHAYAGKRDRAGD